MLIQNRRDFLRTSSLITAGAWINPLRQIFTGDLEKFGIQLYTLRDIIDDDPQGILKSLSSFGFKQIESYEGSSGMFWGMGNKGFKSYLDDLGMQVVSSHCNIHSRFEQTAAEAAEIGMKYLICPSIGPQKSKEDWKKVCDLFNEKGEICKKNGIRFAYHNHAYSFKAFTGMIPHDFLMDNTDPDLVDFQMDIYWVVTGGADPVDYLEKYPNRFKLCHVKDRMKDAGNEHAASCNLGTGIIDFPRILKVAKDQGMEYFIMEQERYDGTTPLDCAREGAKYLQGIQI